MFDLCYNYCCKEAINMYQHQRARDFYIMYKNDATYPAHFHLHCEIFFVLNGVIHATVDGETYVAQKNDILFIAPYQIHSFESASDIGAYVLCISKNHLAEYAEKLDEYVPASPLIHLEDPRQIELCRATLDVVLHAFYAGVHAGLPPETPVNARAMRAYGKAFALMIADKIAFSKRLPNSSEQVLQIIDYCLANFKNDISIAGVSAALGISEHTITRLFSTMLHEGFRSYINKLRIAEAEGLLLQGEESITAVAFAVGFTNPRTFNRAFFAEKGVTPSEFRRKHYVIKE